MGLRLNILSKATDVLLDILFPRICFGCGREGKYVCDKCEIFLIEVENNIPGLVSVWEYEGLMEKLIWKIKFDRKYHILEELVEKALHRIELSLPESAYITYVPMRKNREKERGFNQAALIARRLGQLLPRRKQQPFRVLPMLKKVIDNRSQVGLNPKERIENVRDAFAFEGLFVPENVLLVDDVYTTGATAKECVRVLKKAGVKKVWIFTLARKLQC
ncbi:MAG: ComF family protein [Candidatus Nealsonbacteria bacterium]|nr:ComF family protein [Candidatus Nealsonbacteria bacterium]